MRLGGRQDETYQNIRCAKRPHTHIAQRILAAAQRIGLPAVHRSGKMLDFLQFSCGFVARFMKFVATAGRLCPAARLNRGIPCPFRFRAEAPKAPPGFEPGMANLQSAAFPLGEGAVAFPLSQMRRRGVNVPANH